MLESTGLQCYACRAQQGKRMFTRPARPFDLPKLADMWYERSLLAASASQLVLPADARTRWIAARSSLTRDAHPATEWLGVLVQRDPGCAADDEARGTLAGYVHVRIETTPAGWLPERYGLIDDLGVDLHQYHGGAARLLVQAARAWLHERAITLLCADVPHTSATEQAFWRSLTRSEWMDRLWLKL
jgi:hypothetical protein